MRKVVVNNIVSLDGYYEGPSRDMMVLPMDPAFDTYNRESIERADTVLLGSTSFQGFGSYWPPIADAPEDPDNRALSPDNRALSRRYNAIPKVVVSDTYRPPADHPWHDATTVVPRDGIATWLAEAKAGDGGDILVFGSRTMWNGLLSQGLVDELHLMTGATVLGGGTPAFSAPVSDLHLVDARRFDGSDNVLLVYRTGAAA